MTVPGAAIGGGVIADGPMILTVSGPSQGGFTWLVTEGSVTVEGTLDGENWTALTGETVAGTITRFNVIGLTKVRCTGDGGFARVVA